MTIAFAYTRRPARAHHLPDPAHLVFMLGGNLRPANPPAIRILSATKWLSGDVRYVVCLANNDRLTSISSISAQWLRLAIDMSWHGTQMMGWCMPADAAGTARYGIAAAVRLLDNAAGWSIATQSDQQLLAAWGTAIPRHHAATEATGLLRDLDGLAGERLWHVNLKDRPFDPRYDLVPPLHQLPGQLLVANLAPGNHPPEPDAIRFSWQHDTTIRSIYPRNSATAAAGMGISAEADNQGTGKWGTAGWYTHGGQPGWGDNSGGEIGNLEPPTEPIEEPYRIMNSIACYAIVGSDKVPIEPDGMSLRLLIDSYAWELTGTLYGKTSANYLRPGADGPQHIELTINGWTWLLAIKKYTSRSGITGETYAFTAVSRTGLLDGDWATASTVSLKSNMGAWQLADSLLSPLGFTIERPAAAEWIQTPDWTLQAGSASWVSAKPMAVLSDIAKAAGAVIIPHLTEDKLVVHPRYRVSPWNWQTAPDSAWSHIIPEGVIPSEDSETQSVVSLERVLIAGTTHGVITEVVRAGTAGAISAEDVSDVLAQDVAINTERGRNILSEQTGTVEVITASIPLLPPGQAPGLVVPGDLVKIQREDGSFTRGLVLGNTITPSFSAVWQQVYLEVHHGNS